MILMPHLEGLDVESLNSRARMLMRELREVLDRRDQLREAEAAARKTPSQRRREFQVVVGGAR